MYVVDKATMQLAEAKADSKGTTFFALMQNAGEQAAEYILNNTKAANQKVLILCGKGNNGGDGFVMAGRLAEKHRVTVALVFGEPSTETARQAFAQMPEDKVEIIGPEDCINRIKTEKFDITVDAVFGTGYNGQPPKGSLAELFEIIQKSD